jgi:SAM-dependent methyltransferase
VDVDRVGGGFLDVSCPALGYLIQLAGLKPDSHVLDVGCGTGRIAFILAHHLEPTARYEGFDIMEDLIRWDEREITTRVPHFRFQHVNVYNKYYNPSGTLSASEFRFPYPNRSFDLVYLGSVFTHMLADEVRHYLDEIERVLRPGGRCLATCFLMNEESRALIDEGRSSQPLIHPANECFVSNPEIPEWVVGYDESVLLGWIAERGFTLGGKYYGFWCGRGKFRTYQDIMVYQKKAGVHPHQQRAFHLRGGGPGRGLAGFFRGFRWGRRAASA